MNWFREYPKRNTVHWIGAVMLLVLIAWLAWWGENAPLWEMHMKAPQYPNGLVLIAYGDHMEGNVSEINILNQYIGMKSLDTKEIKAMVLCPFAVGSIVLLAILAFMFPRFRWLFSILAMSIPIGMLATIQYYLYHFGHTLDPSQNLLRMEPFTPHVIGPTSVKQFNTMSLPGLGFWLLMVASVLIGFGNRLARSIVHGKNPFNPKQVAIPATLVFLVAIAAPSYPQALQNLQSRIDAASAGATIVVTPGQYLGPIRITKPLTLIGEGQPEIRGDGVTSVVSITSNDVTLEGFLVRFSGKEVSEEAAGVTSQGSNITIRSNEVRDCYFGIHVTSGNNILVADNLVHPGKEYGDRPGHGVNAWNVAQVTIKGNTIYDARDGVILTYAEHAVVDSNYVTDCRYGLHSMYSKNLAFTRNYVTKNLLGVALMYTDSMLAEENEVTDQQVGATPYGFLFKDLNNLQMRRNRISGNRIGIYMDGLSMELGSSSRIADNIIAGNERGISAMSNVAFTFSNNTVSDNLVDIFNEGEHVSPNVHWSDAGHGNYWSEYHGFDKNGDGVGDLEYREENITEAVLNTENPARAFIFTPAHVVLDAALRMFPLFHVAPIVSDAAPLMQPVKESWKEGVPPGRSFVMIPILSAMVFTIALWTLWKWRPFRRTGYWRAAV